MAPIDVFIAHAGPDRDRAVELHAAVRALGLVPFVDAIDLLPGDEWDLLLAEAQRRARLTAVLVGPTYDAAYYLREEVASAVAYARAGFDHRAVPVFLTGLPSDPSRVPYGLRVRTALDWPRLGAVGVANELARALGVPAAVAPPPLPPTQPELDRATRYDVLIRLLPGQLGEVLLRIAAPTQDFPSQQAPQSERALSIVQWVDLQTVPTRLRFDGLLRAAAPGLF